MPLKALIFDFNGVLVDDENVHFELLAELLAPFTITLTREVYFKRYFVYDDSGVFIRAFADAGIPRTPTQIREICEEKAARYAALPPERFRYYEASEALARDAAAHVPLAIASGARAAEIRRHLSLRGLAPLFPVVVSIDDVKNGKPDPEPYLEAARGLGIAPVDCVAIEDSPGGVVSARAAGMATVGLGHTIDKSLLLADLALDSLKGIGWQELVRRLGK